MKCFFCSLPILSGDEVNHHHVVYKSRGGTETAPSHKACHRAHHQNQGDFITWGKLSALTRAWAFNLRNVRSHPAYDFDRAYYLMNYAH
jgi:hypothetical protein